MRQISATEKEVLARIVNQCGLPSVIIQSADSDTTCGELFLGRLQNEEPEFVLDAFLSACEKRIGELRTLYTAFDRDQLKRLERITVAIRTAAQQVNSDN